jgi:hypothetical protein
MKRTAAEDTGRERDDEEDITRPRRKSTLLPSRISPIQSYLTSPREGIWRSRRKKPYEPNAAEELEDKEKRSTAPIPREGRKTPVTSVESSASVMNISRMSEVLGSSFLSLEKKTLPKEAHLTPKGSYFSRFESDLPFSRIDPSPPKKKRQKGKDAVSRSKGRPNEVFDLTSPERGKKTVGSWFGKKKLEDDTKKEEEGGNESPPHEGLKFVFFCFSQI